MEILTLATAVITLARPFLNKVGEGSALKIGEDIWKLLKGAFEKKNIDIDQMNASDVPGKLVELLNEDPDLKNNLEQFVSNAQTQIGAITQNVTNHGSIEKQINFGNVTGNITL